MQIIIFHLQWVVVQTVAERLTLWCQNNSVKLNPDQFHLLLGDKKCHQVDICNKNFWSTCNEKFLGIKVDNKLTFEDHVEDCAKKRTVQKSQSKSQCCGKNFVFNDIWTKKAYC